MDGYKRISQYKTPMMGIAVMIVVYGHLLYYHANLIDYADNHFTEWYTLGSVEMFMFLSGFGIYQSLFHNFDIPAFYQRRFSRLAPVYLPIMAVFCLGAIAIRKMTFSEVIGNMTALGYWFQTGHQFNWYVPATVILYLLSPLFFTWLQKPGYRPLLGFAVLILVHIAAWHSNYLMAISRFITYYMGMYCGKQYAEGKAPTKKSVTVWCFIGALAMVAVPFIYKCFRNTLWYYGNYWNPFIVAAPLWMYGISWILFLQEKKCLGRAVNKVWNFLGERSFEIYLCHLMLYMTARHFGISGWALWICMAILGTAIGIGYHSLISILRVRCRSCK